MSAAIKIAILANAIKAKQAFSETEQAAEKTQSKLSRIGGKIGTSMKVGALAGVAALTGLAKSGLSTAADMEQAEISFTTMLGSGSKAKAFIADLSKFAAETPFDFPGLQSASSSLISAGIDSKRVIPIMRTLGDVTSGMGTGSEGIARATVALQQMSAAQKISAEDLNQLRDAGIPVYDLLAASLGKTKKEIAEMAGKGKLGKDALDALMKGLESGKGLERFNGLMQKQSQSLSGLWSTLKDTWSMGLSQAIAPAIPKIKAVMGKVAGVLPTVMKGVQWVFGALSKAASWVVGKLKGVYDKMGGWKQIVGDARKATAPLVDKIREVVDSLGGWEGILARVRKPIDALASGAKSVYNALGGWQGILGGVSTALSGVITLMGNPIFQTVAGAVLAAVAAYKAYMVYLAVVQAATKAYAAVQAALNVVMMLNPVGLIIAAIVGLIAVIVIAYKKSDTFKRIVDGAFKGVLKAAQAAWNWIKKNWSLLLAIITGPFGLAVRFIIKHRDSILDTIKSIPDKIKGFFSGAGDWLKDAGRKIIDGLLDGINKGFDLVKDKLGKLTDMLPDWKGPASKDAKLLTKNGQLIIDGFRKGLESRYSSVQKSLGGFTNDLAGTTTKLDVPAVSANNGKPEPIVIKIDSGGSRTDDFIVELLRRSIRTRGGNVQAVLGS